MSSNLASVTKENLDEYIASGKVVVLGDRDSGVLIEGDGKAEFLPDMTEEELREYEHEELDGWKSFLDKLPWRKT